jgi:hypothetical protein
VIEFAELSKETVKKVNVHRFYRLANIIHPLTELPTEETTAKIHFRLFWQAKTTLSQYLAEESMLPPSSKRAAAVLMAQISDCGLPDDISAFKGDAKVPRYEMYTVVQRAKEFEIVLANDLPGMDTYHVYQKGIYSTPALIDFAERALLDGLTEAAKNLISADVLRDFNQAGRCLAFELPTASGFHTMRSVEALLREYWTLVKRPPEGMRPPEMATCINELRAAGEDKKVMDILDHVRDLNRNPLMHPEAFLELNEALRLFDIAKSAISAMAERVEDIVSSKLAPTPAVVPTVEEE